MIEKPQGRPPFRADHVGSLLRPQVLRQAFRDHAGKRIDDAHFAQITDGCIRDVVKMQEDVGLKVVTDGEFRRGSYWGRFVERIDGFVIKPALFTATRLNSRRLMRMRSCTATSRLRSTNINS